MRVTFDAPDLTEIIVQLERFIHVTRAGLVVPAPGYGIERGLSSMASLAADQVHQAGYKLGYNAGFGEACDRATMDQALEFPDVPEHSPATKISLAESHERRARELRAEVGNLFAQAQRPEGCRDYMPGPEPSTGAVDWEKTAEANRKTAAAAAQQRANQAYPVDEGKQAQGQSLSSPDMVARAINKSGRPLPGE